MGSERADIKFHASCPCNKELIRRLVMNEHLAGKNPHRANWPRWRSPRVSQTTVNCMLACRASDVDCSKRHISLHSFCITSFFIYYLPTLRHRTFLLSLHDIVVLSNVKTFLSQSGCEQAPSRFMSSVTNCCNDS